ncbi:MAG: lysine--tRNA ligase [Candidatus Cloacimonadaceae bacterium]|jgi:lysyl-tRNA synthetase class 2|nr:lysine--tRNA ligase [Candidatus Cloacimonadota bacterium]MDX9950026.1 lysine--tRNA ligase [Candidatus Syntrophosphaera sp.]
MRPKDNQLIQLRKQKLAKLIEAGIDPYPIASERSHRVAEVLENKETWVESEQEVTLTGRLVAMRRQGKLGFGDLEDAGGRIQVYVAQNLVGEENYELFKLCDPGDFVQLRGTLFFTQAGEYSIKVNQVKLLAKNLRPIPAVKEKVVDGKTIRYDEFSDIELRYRKRYLDLLLNPAQRQVFVQRAKIITAIRAFLDKRGFIEVETPVLQPLYGGANARPFITHHNTLDVDLYLRIATELYLKRLMVGGFEAVYELGKDFRNEGMSRVHNPEFTMLELYEAYSDLRDVMNLTEDLLRHLALDVLGKKEFVFRGHKVDLSKPFERVPMIDLVKEYAGIDLSDMDMDKAKAFCDERKIEIPPGSGVGKIIALLFEEYVEPKLVQPTFVTDFPKEVSPLAKSISGYPELADRFEIYIAGHEFGNAFSELNDPLDQRARLEAQAALRALGDEEANPVDEDFLEALEYGMPPLGGLGIGIDRLVMLLTENDSIKEVILFPQMKPE